MNGKLLQQIAMSRFEPHQRRRIEKRLVAVQQPVIDRPVADDRHSPPRAQALAEGQPAGVEGWAVVISSIKGMVCSPGWRTGRAPGWVAKQGQWLQEWDGPGRAVPNHGP